MLLAVVATLGGLALLAFGADRFVAGAVATARNLGVSNLIIGLTVVGMATSMPEALVGAVAAWDGKTHIAIGNAIGSNIANVGLVLGATALFWGVRAEALGREFSVMGLAMLLALLLMLDQHLSRLDGALLLAALLLSVGWVVRGARQTSPATEAGAEAGAAKRLPSLGKSLLLMCVGLLVLLGGAELLVRGAVQIAQILGVSDLVIGLTIVAVGTSLPELAACIASVLKKEADIVIGNIIGSNMFNMLMVLGLPCVIHPIAFGGEVLARDFSVMIGITLLMGWMVFVSSKAQIRRWEGAALLLCFAGYQYGLFQG